jgi:hypothetical protein
MFHHDLGKETVEDQKYISKLTSNNFEEQLLFNT